MAKQLTEDELNMRRRARRRLIGAIALTLAVVVILPMVLDSEPKSAVPDIELRIPAPDKAGEFIPASAVSGMTGAASVPAPLAVSAPIQVPLAVSAPTQAPLAVSAPFVAASSVAAAETKPSRVSDAGDESFVAQVGAYANADTARQEANRLKKMGFKAYTEKVGDKIRVRVGPYAERDKAEKVRHLLEKHGLHPVVTSAK